MKTRAITLALAALICAAAASAQVRDRTFEISPYGGYQFGGEFENGSTDLFDFDVQTDDDFSYGVRLGYNVSSNFQLELQLSHTATEFVEEGNGGLFAPDDELELGDLDIDYLLGSMVFNFGRRRVVPYISIGGGVARLDPNDFLGADEETRFTATLGGGIKTFFTPHFGLRFDGRGYATSLGDNDDNDFFCDDDHFFDDCDSDRNDWLTTGEVSLGLLFAF